MTDQYVHGHHASVLSGHQWRTVDNSAKYLVPFLKADANILDVGCGPGTLTADLAASCPRGSVVGIDPSIEVIQVAQQTLPPAQNLSFEVGDASSLRFASATFDIAHAHQVLQHVPDPILILEEMARVTRPKGIIAVRDSDYSAFTWSPDHESLDRWMEIYRIIARICGGEPDAGRYLTSWAKLAGLDVTSASTSQWFFGTPEDVAWWGAMWSERVVQSNFATNAIKFGVATILELEDLRNGWLDWSNRENAQFVVQHYEVIATL